MALGSDSHPGKQEFAMSKTFVLTTVALFLACAASAQKATSQPQSCEKLPNFALSKAKIVSAQTIEAGAFTPPAITTPWLIGNPELYKTLGHPEKVIDFGYRAIHEMTQIAKTLITAFYGNNPQHYYFDSCSNGGRQALMEAQRFPGDYDGIISGAPANFWTHLLTKALADAQATTLDPASYIPSSKLPALARAVNAE